MKGRKYIKTFMVAAGDCPPFFLSVSSTLSAYCFYYRLKTSSTFFCSSGD